MFSFKGEQEHLCLCADPELPELDCIETRNKCPKDIAVGCDGLPSSAYEALPPFSATVLRIFDGACHKMTQRELEKPSA